jgi:hypothetical protein
MTVLPASASVLKGSELASRRPEWSPSAHDGWTLKDREVRRYQMQQGGADNVDDDQTIV